MDDESFLRMLRNQGLELVEEIEEAELEVVDKLL